MSVHDWEGPSGRIWALVAGLPPKKRGVRLLLLLQAYVDDSGNGTEPVLVLAGYVAPVASWASFSKEWQELLDYYHLEYFKMNEAAGRWLSRGEIEPLLFFYRVIERHVSAEVRCLIPHDEWRAAISEIYTLPADDMLKAESFNYYFAAFQFVQQLADKQADMGLGHHKVEVIFDTQMHYDRKMLSAWDQMLAASEPKVQNMLSGYPRFLSDKEYLPLQAADFSAWWTRKEWAEKGLDSDPWPYPWQKSERRYPLFQALFMKENILEALWRGHWARRLPFLNYTGRADPGVFRTGKFGLFGFKAF